MMGNVSVWNGLGIAHNLKESMGSRRAKLFAVTFGMNKKGGVNTVKFQKHVDVAIFCLHPDMCDDAPGKGVLTNVDSGPSHMNIEMLAALRLKGMCLMPAVANATQVTQETDQRNGQHKSIYRKNIRLLLNARQPFGRHAVLVDLALLIFGGRDRMGIKIENTFEKGFSM